MTDPSSDEITQIADRLGEVWPAHFGAEPMTRLGWHGAALMLWQAGWRGDTDGAAAQPLLRKYALKVWTPSLSEIALRLDLMEHLACAVDGRRCTGRRAYWRLIECGRPCCSPCLTLMEAA
jgi:hypothetical protein